MRWTLLFAALLCTVSFPVVAAEDPDVCLGAAGCLDSQADGEPGCADGGQSSGWNAFFSDWDGGQGGFAFYRYCYTTDTYQAGEDGVNGALLLDGGTYVAFEWRHNWVSSAEGDFESCSVWVGASAAGNTVSEAPGCPAPPPALPWGSLLP